MSGCNAMAACLWWGRGGLRVRPGCLLGCLLAFHPSPRSNVVQESCPPLMSPPPSLLLPGRAAPGGVPSCCGPRSASATPASRRGREGRAGGGDACRAGCVTQGGKGVSQAGRGRGSETHSVVQAAGPARAGWAALVPSLADRRRPTSSGRRCPSPLPSCPSPTLNTACPCRP